MASPAPASHDEPIVGINVTPLVDITLVLLIIFMVTAKLIAAQTIPFDLPKAASAGETQAVFVIAVDPDGRVQADGRTMATDADLRQAAKDALARDREVRTIVQAASGITHGAVIHVLDELRGAGVQKIAFGVDKKVTEAAR